MKRIYLIISLLIVLCFQEIQAQVKKWSLEDCITYAVTNNIGLKRQMLQTESAEVNLLKSKMDILPSLNFQSNANIQYGRSVDPISNGITFLQNLTNYYDLSSNIRLFNGFTILNTISANKFMLKAGLEEEKIVRNTLIINIMGQYYQVCIPEDLRMLQKCSLNFRRNSFSELQKWLKQEKRLCQDSMKLKARFLQTNSLIQLHIILPARHLQRWSRCYSWCRVQILIFWCLIWIICWLPIIALIPTVSITLPLRLSHD